MGFRPSGTRLFYPIDEDIEWENHLAFLWHFASALLLIGSLRLLFVFGRLSPLVWFKKYVFHFQKKAPGKDLFQLFAEKVRDHKEFESRWAVLQETRVEYFRGKDFVSFVKNHPDLLEVLESDKALGAEDIANVLLSKNLLVRCDRVVKTVRPGKKKLSTWPAHLEIFSVSAF